jgi:hypothetical protein
MLKEFFKIDEVRNHAKEYIDTKFSLLKLTMAEKISNLVSLLIAGAIVFFIFFFVFVFVGLAAADAIGTWLGHTWLGLLTVAIIYFLLGFVILTNREKLIRIPLMKVLMRQLFSEDEKINEHDKN